MDLDLSGRSSGNRGAGTGHQGNSQQSYRTHTLPPDSHETRNIRGNTFSSCSLRPIFCARVPNSWTQFWTQTPQYWLKHSDTRRACHFQKCPINKPNCPPLVLDAIRSTVLQNRGLQVRVLPL